MGGDVLGYNLFAYCGNNPVIRADHGGQFWDYVIDAVFLVWSVFGVINEPGDWRNWAALGVDVVFAVAPFVPSGAGQVLKAGNKVDNALDAINAAKVIDRADDTVEIIKSGWRVGDDISNLTKAGHAPTWSTVRQRYWKNEAFYNAGNYSASNLNRMKTGKAPLVELNGKYYSMELHHKIPRHMGGSNTYDNLLQVTPWDHASIDPFRFFNP